jgi:serine/threonine protein kinase
MRANSKSTTRAAHKRARTLEARWQKLCALYLPLAGAGSIWNYHRAAGDGPAHGWKLHVSATILNAPKILERIVPLLIRTGVQFKAPRSLSDVAALNAGMRQAYTQVGKVITVYPRSDKQAVQLASRLHQLTRRFNAPAVPFDLQFCDASNVYYRYGAFKKMRIEHQGSYVLAVSSGNGDLTPDDRRDPNPDRLPDPFAAVRTKSSRRKTTANAVDGFHVLGALVQRGKGGVYQAIDMHANPPRLCLLKEGRRHGEVSLDGRDGAWRVRHEQRVLALLKRRRVRVPNVYASFVMDANYYLAMEFIDGESLHEILLRQQRRLSVANIISLGSQLSKFLAQLHAAGWVWRDCKPKNLIISRAGELVPIDFEGASEIDNPDSSRWGTPGFVPSKSPKDLRQAVIDDDLFGLGATLYLLITGHVFDPQQPNAIVKFRPQIPRELVRLVESLLNETGASRPTAAAARAILNSILRKPAKTPLRLATERAA